METKEQLEKLVKKKWRKGQITALIGAVSLGTLGYFAKLPIAAIFACFLCVLAYLNEFMIDDIPNLSADELRGYLKRNR